MKSRLRSKSDRSTTRSQEQATVTTDSHSRVTSRKSNLTTRPLTPNYTLNKHEYHGSVARDGTPVISSLTADHFRPSDVCAFSSSKEKTHKGNDYRSSKSGKRRGRQVLNKPPTAKDSAFSGPPRYDWIDIETAATVKVQSIVRRNQVMDQLTRQNVSTAAMRNRVRAKGNRRKKAMASEDVPGLLRFCGIGFLFGDATGEDQDVLNANEKVLFLKERLQKEMEDAKKRKLRLRKKSSQNLLESVEVVEDLSHFRYTI
eukprot:CAMPEP_0197832524 /NCGR_PEP_ID=MMETSP1437-20131217/15218_1 /TAXON_ID=49252 ORGANISM="Eucampia antarctica, Strain CCMP1452" /NCGR_SAMPLE_ID=MMETSP1437 /ASSEMBLY_ACC=CAM_ASM_001096 /LENGTH=257 /DNA_ID=CAMNT_0043435951 /DNA_START=1 /DNA_END=774 /DNA_ORIENTATION=+